MQIQLKPHFYLNCLKTLYGMIQGFKNEKAQQMILRISEYIRYTFRDNSTLVPLDVELNRVKNYYDILQSSTAKPARLTISAPDELKSSCSPALYPDFCRKFIQVCRRAGTGISNPDFHSFANYR